MKYQIRQTVATALFLGLPAVSVFTAVPATAATRVAAAPAIGALQVNADSGLAPGSTLAFTVEGTPRSKVRVQVVGTGLAIALHESTAGVYTGNYTVRRAERIAPSSVIRASLTSGPRTAIANYSFPPAFMARGPSSRPPEVAQQQPLQQPQEPPLRIERFGMAPVNAIEPGAELRFSLNGAPGGAASFDIPGVATDVPMREIRPGHYVGSYTVRRQDNVGTAPVVATLRSGDRWVTASLNRPTVADNTAPTISNLVPRQGEAVTGAGVTVVSGSFDDAGGTGVDPRSVRITVSGRDVTADTQVTPQDFSYRGSLPPGRHTAEVTARDVAGNTTQKSWTFDVGTPMGAAAATVVPLQVLSPNANAVVDGSQVLVQGRTSPGALVRVKVDAVAPNVGNRLSVAQPVMEQTVQADAQGHFSFNFGPQRVMPGTRYEVSMTANQAGQTAEEKLVLFQRRG